MEVGVVGPGHNVLDGNPAALPKKGAELPNFRPIFIVARRLDATRCHLVWRYRPQPRRLCVRWDPVPPQNGRTPQFSAHVYCSQTAAWIKMSLGTEIGLGLRGIVFDVDPATPRKRHTHPHPIFGPCLLWPNGWMDEDAACYVSRPRPRQHCTRRGHSSCESGTAAPPLLFGPCLLWPRSPISATAELLYKLLGRIALSQTDAWSVCQSVCLYLSR